jgi:putative membrane protein insertion efficiency factor
MKRMLIFLIRMYQYGVSPLLPFNHCRFYPSCSNYSLEAIKKHGVKTGVLLTGKRIAKCHPFSVSGGYDPVP